MAKQKTVFHCQNCGTSYAKWQGQCNACKEWNTLQEELVQKTSTKSWQSTTEYVVPSKPLPVASIEGTKEDRFTTNNQEFDRVLGGGIVKGSMCLLGGEPGIGKSTLLLQVALSISNKVLYVSGEESQTQIKMRADRLKDINPNCLIVTETNTQHIFKHIQKTQPDIVVIDSIQTLFSSVIESSIGSVSQIKQVTSELTSFAKETNTPILIIGHITKDGNIAGPKVLEHMVDVVLHFEGDRNHTYRILRAQKNRFGSTAEIGIYEMLSYGLREVHNPSEILIGEKDSSLSGSCIAATMEGVRPLMIETQALVSSAVYGTPQRSATGYNIKRLHMLLAVLEKRIGFKLGIKDVFLNIAGGISIEDPAIDLSVIVAILSSNNDTPIPQEYCFAAEVGLSGEIRPVSRIAQRISEAEKLGFKRIYISKYNKIAKEKHSIQIITATKIEDILPTLF